MKNYYQHLMLNKDRLVYLSLNFFLLLTALTLFIIPGYIVEYAAKQITEVQPTFFGFKYWEAPPIETKVSLYIYNVTNAEAFFRRKCKPILVEHGPYRYKFVSTKKNILWDQTRGTVQYQLSENYTYMGDTPTTNENQEVVIPNPILFGMFSLSEKKKKMEQLGMRVLVELFPDQLFVRRKVGDIFFKGYYDPVLDLAQKVSGESTVPDAIVSFLKEANGTDDRQYTISSGIKDRSTIYEMQEFNKSSYFNHWPSPACDKVRGTDGGFYPFSVTRESPIDIFKPRFCRPLRFKYTKDVNVKGISGYRFDIPFSTMASGNWNRENKCYCLGPCLDSGLIDVSPCQKNVSIAISLPHLKWVEKVHLRRFIDKTPLRKYESYVELCPFTGTALTINISTQINFLFKDMRGVINDTYIPGLVFPIFWMRLEAEIPDDIAQLVWIILTAPFIVSYSLGSLLLLIVSLVAINKWKRNSTSNLKGTSKNDKKIGNIEGLKLSSSQFNHPKSESDERNWEAAFKFPKTLGRVKVLKLKKPQNNSRRIHLSTML